MKRLMMVLAMVALVLAVTVPAIAQGNNHHHHNNANNNNGGGGGPSVTQPFDQQSESGNVTVTGTATQSGNNSNQCVTPLQFGNTGSLQNEQGVLQYNSTAGDIQFEGPTFEFTPTLNATCNQAVQQSAAASGN